jgi:hypothetical protein
MSMAVATAALPARDDTSARTLRFTGVLLFACLVLQRFGLPFGVKALNIVGPIGLGLAGIGLATGVLVFNRARLATYLVLAALVLAGVAWHVTRPGGGFGGPTNFNSLSQFLLLTGFATLSFAEPVEEGRFYHTVNRWFAVIAVAGLLQFAAQFAGLRVFAFTGLLPSQILFEAGYNQQIPVGVGDLLKSNGFFLVEPSVFSQIMALALIIEILAFRRLVYLGLFVGGLLLSFSGTGWIVLGSFIVASAIGMGQRGVAIAVVTVVVLAAVLTAGALLVPDIAGALHDRASEISRPGTSGHLRFVTPFWVMDDVLTAEPSAAVLGIGSGVSERLTLPYDYDVNTPVKVALDYGFPVLLAYVLVFMRGRRTPVQAGLLVPAMVLFFIAGGYQEFPPVIFLVLMLATVPRLTTEPDAVRAVPSPSYARAASA